MQNNKSHSVPTPIPKNDRSALLRDFHSADHRSPKRTATGLCVLFGIAALFALILVLLLTASYSASGSIILPSFFPLLVIVITAVYALASAVTIALANRAELRQFARLRGESATDTPAIRLFKESIDLPYVVTDESGKIIVANHAFEEAVATHPTSVGEDIRDICTAALDTIIRATDAESDVDKKISEIHAAAVRAYPNAWRSATSTDACIAYLKEIDRIALAAGAMEEQDASSPLRRVHEIADGAFRETEKRAELWRLCLSTLERILTVRSSASEDSENLSHIYELARDAYRLAVEKERELKQRSTLRDFSSALRKIISAAENDPLEKQLHSAAVLRLEMFEGKNLLHHTRTVLYNIRRQLAEILPESTDEEDRTHAALRALLRTTEESSAAATERIEQRERDRNAEDLSADREFARGTLEMLIRIADTVESDAADRGITQIREVADTALAALLPERFDEYLARVTAEFLSAIDERREPSPTTDEIRSVTEALRTNARNGNRADEERFIAAFRDAVSRIAEESRFGSEHTLPESERIRTIIEHEVSGALSFLETRTTGVAALSALIKQGEEVGQLRDLSKSDQKLAALSVERITALRDEILSTTVETPQAATVLSHKIAQTLSDLLSRFDEKDDYTHRASTPENERSATSRMKLLYSEISKTASRSFPLTSRQISDTFFSRAALALMGYRLYSAVLRKAESLLPPPEPIDPSDGGLAEITEKEYADKDFTASATRLLLHIGVLRVYAARQQLGSLSELQTAAEITFEKIAVRRILSDALVSSPINSILSASMEGASDEALYKQATAHFREASIHDKRHLHTFCRALTARTLSFLENATALSEAEEGESTLLSLSALASHARALLMSHGMGSRVGDPLADAADQLRACAALLEPEKGHESTAGILYASISYLIEFISDLNSRLLRREFYRTYRDTAGSIVSHLYRAEYTKVATEEIRKISESILSSTEKENVSFSGRSVEDCCSCDLRTIAGLARTDAIRTVRELADTHAREALTAKALWELRKETLLTVKNRLLTAEATARFHDERLLPLRHHIAALRALGSALAEKKADADPLSEENRAHTERESVLLSLAALEPLTLPSADCTPAERRLAECLTALRCIAESKDTDGTADLATALLSTAAQLDKIAAETLSVRRNKKRFRLLRRALTEEEATSFRPRTGVPLSRIIVFEHFSEYLNATLRTVRSNRENDPPMEDLYQHLSAVKTRIEDDASPYFRLYAESTLSLLSGRIREDFTTDLFRTVTAPTLRLSDRCIEQLRGAQSLSRDAISSICLSVFHEADVYFRFGEFANESLRIITRYAETETPPSSECTRIYHTLSELSQKIEGSRQGSVRTDVARQVLSQLSDAVHTLRESRPNLEQDRISSESYAAMYQFFSTVSKITAPYLILSESRDASALRTEIAQYRRSVREISEATAGAGAREIAESALAAIGRFAKTVPGERIVITLVERAVAELSAVSESASAPERVSAIATEALARILVESENATLRQHARAAHADLSERLVLYRHLVTAPIDALVAAYTDPTDERIYTDAQIVYRDLESVSDRFRAEVRLGMLRDWLSATRTASDSGAFGRLRAITDVLIRLCDEFEAEIRALPIGEGEYFVPPAVRAKQKQLRSWISRLFEFSKRASAESKDHPERAAIAEHITLIVYEGMPEFDAVAASKEDGAMNRLSGMVRELVRKTLAALHPTERSERCLAELRRRIDALLDNLSLPSVLDRTVSKEEYAALYSALLTRIQREALTDIELLSHFLQETEEEEEENTVDTDLIRRLSSALGAVCTAIEEAVSDSELSAETLSGNVAELIRTRILNRNGIDQELVAVYDEKGKPAGQNNASLRIRKKNESFRPVVQNEESSYFAHGLSVAEAEIAAGQSVTLGGSRYIARSYPHRSGGKNYYLVTFSPVEAALRLKQSCEDENTVVALITLDNLEELAQYVRIDYREAEKDVEKVLRNWAGRIHGIFHEYERDKYILFFAQKELPALINSRFSELLTRLEHIRLGDSSVSVTISMGISALGSTLTIKEQNASLALDMALKRGGAQIAVHRDETKCEERYEFFSGNRVKGLQKESRVGARVVSDYLCELIRKSGDVLVMGHASPDFDSIGSCVGIAALARYLKKDVHIVVNRHARNFIDCTPDLLPLPEYRNTFIDGTTGMELKGTDTLLILCDVSNTNIMESIDIARTSFNTVIIDHHIKTTDSEELRTLLTYVDPSASSASELVAEILEEALPKDALRKEEANVLLSGIMVDTKNFTRSVGARTFAAALYLRQMGANAEISGTYFYEENGDYKAEVIFRRNLEFHEKHRNIAITFCSPEDLYADPDVQSCDLRVAASKAADKLLTVRGVRAAFALYPYGSGGKTGIAISGRSDGSVNVQEILEVFHGGGHFDSAGASLPGKSISEVRDALSSVIEDYFREDEPEEDGTGNAE